MILACVFFWSILSYVFFSRYVIRATEVEGVSMAPTLYSGDRLLLERFAFRHVWPDRGEIVAIQMPYDEGMIVKRVVARPGEQVQILDGKVWINGGLLPEPYLPPGVATGLGMLTTNAYVVGRGCFFVLGDNREQSLDSRYFGAVNGEWIVGRVVGLRQALLDALGL
jgi:signal peptidase I